MLVGRIEARGFKRYKAASVDLPTRGTVLVTGKNGAGKSSLLDAVAWALWGRTMRGGSPVQGATSPPPCVVALECAAVEVTRERAGRKASLVWSRPGDAPVEYETPTKAQAALEVVVGSFDMWRRTAVFSGRDAWSFADATDAQRKVMLEALFGLEVFDEALARCRADVQAATAAVARDEQQLARERGVLTQATAQVTALRNAQPGEEPDTAMLVGQLRRLDAALESVTADSAVLVAALREVDAELRTAQAAGASADARGAGVARPSCDACGQYIPGKHAEEVRAQAVAARASADRRAADATKRIDALHAERAAHDVEVKRLRERRDAILRQQASVDTIRRQRDTWAKLLRDAEAAAATAATTEKALAQRVAEGRQRLEDLRHTEAALGMRGIRAQVLDGALSAVERVANVWLVRFAGEGVEVKLRSRSPLKSGGTADTINVEVIGLGGHEGYAGASTGERVRVDVALMLALADVARIRAGIEPGTLFFDEVFDALDPEGIDAVCAALREIAAQRPVVVISHDNEMIARLNAGAHYHADDGALVRRR